MGGNLIKGYLVLVSRGQQLDKFRERFQHMLRGFRVMIKHPYRTM